MAVLGTSHGKVSVSVSCWPGGVGGGGVLPIMAYRGRLRPKEGYLFQASGI